MSELFGQNFNLNGQVRGEFGPLGWNVSMKDNGTFGAQVTYGIFQGRFSIDQGNQNTYAAFGIGRNFGSFTSGLGQATAFAGIGIDRTGSMFAQFMYGANFYSGGKAVTTGFRGDYKVHFSIISQLNENEIDYVKQNIKDIQDLFGPIPVAN